MSDDLDKSKHSKRIQQKENYVVKQAKIAKAHSISVDEPHRLAKHSAMNCGNPKCIFCGNPRETFNEKTIQEKRFEQSKLNEE